MPEERPEPDRDALRHMGYERQDISLHAIIRAVIALFAFIAFAALLSLGLFAVLVPRGAERRQAFPLSTVRRLPPSPRIQAYPVRDIRQFLAEEDKQLTTYGWVDLKAGVVRIPVEQAETVLLERGLPVKPMALPRAEATPGGSPPPATEGMPAPAGTQPQTPATGSAPGAGQIAAPLQPTMPAPVNRGQEPATATPQPGTGR